MATSSWNAGIIRPVAIPPAGPYANSAAPGVWTLDQQAFWQKQGVWPIAGNVQNYIEDVFSTYLYTGTGANGLQIQNGIDLAGKGGLVFGKARSGTNAGTVDWGWVDTVRGGSSVLYSNTTDAAQSTALVSSFNADGFTLNGAWPLNYYGSPYTYGSWTFRKQPKFFDVVTYSGNSTAGREISHNLGSAPGCIIVKRLDSGDNWPVYHRGVSDSFIKLNTTDANAAANAKYYWGNNTIFIAPTSTVFTVATDSSINQTGGTYVAYLFAHDAGGFGLTGTDNVISCGSFTTDGSGNASVALGYEPQFVMWKKSSAAGAWNVQDVMRGMPVTGDGQFLEANAPDAEYGASQPIRPNATGFYGALTSNASSTYIYIAIRRGPMKVPTSGTSVFSPITNSASTGTVNTTGFPVDMGIVRWRSSSDSNFLRSRLQGVSSTTTESGAWLATNSTNAESTSGGLTRLWNNTGFQTTSGFSGLSTVYWNFGRAPSFFDEVCYTGNNGSNLTVAHNLGVIPELVILKKRSSGTNSAWGVSFNFTSTNQNNGFLNNTDASTNDTYANIGWMTQQPTSSNIYLAVSSNFNYNVETFVGYLFATCAGVSKVGSYTGNGSTQTIDCGFGAGGARFVLIKRTDSTGDWYVYDTARGMTVLTDPYLRLNSTAAESATLGSVTTVSTGFAVNASILAAINTNAASYLFLAIS